MPPSPPTAAPRPAVPGLAVPWSAVLFALAINVLWGGNVPAVKMGLLAIPPMWSGFWRFTVGVGCVGLWALWQGTRLRPLREEWAGLALLGGIFTAQIAVMNVGIGLTSGALASILIATNPLFAALLAHVFIAGDRLTPLRTTGLLVAFAGICAIFLRDAATALGNAGMVGNLLCLATAALLAARLVFTARLVQRMETTRVVFWQMLFSLPCFAAAGWLSEQVRWEALGWYPLAGIAYQGIVVAGFNFMGIAYLLRRYPPSIVTGYNFVSPVCGVLLSILLLAESPGWPVAAGLLAVGLGLYLITRR